MMTERQFLTESSYGRDIRRGFPALCRFLEDNGFIDASRAVAALHAAHDDHSIKVCVRVLREVQKNLDAPAGAPVDNLEPEPPLVETAPERRDSSVVYFIQAISGGPIKIGYTKSISQRLAATQTHSAERMIVIASFPGGAAEEGALHWKLKAHRVNGEWYSPAPEVMAEIERVSA